MSPLQVFSLVSILATCFSQSQQDWNLTLQRLRPLVCTQPCDEFCGVGKANNFCEVCGCNSRDVCTNYPCPVGQMCRPTLRGWMRTSWPSCVQVDPRMVTLTDKPTSRTTTTRFPQTQGGKVHPCPRERLCMFDSECDFGLNCLRIGDPIGRCCLRKYSYIKPRCRMNKEAGPCRAGLMRWFYNTTSSSCQSFLFGGCSPSENHFESEKACREECEHECLLPLNAGFCRAVLRKYRFNETSGQCEEFLFGGCGGNDNNYDTRALCEQRCLRAPYKY